MKEKPNNDNKKVVLIGCGMVGMSYAYSLLNQDSPVDELVLVDISRERAEGEALDLNHGLAFARSSMKIRAGEYSDASDADLVVIAAGVNQKPGESRIDLLSRNREVFKSIIGPVVDSGFSGIFLVATNPVDIMTKVTIELSGFPKNRVMGSGTTLDTARLRYILAQRLGLDSRNIHAYVIGEHGESEFVPWSQAHVATIPLLELMDRNPGIIAMDELDGIESEVRNSAQKIIAAKKATYYGIGMALTRITKAIFSDERSILTVSSDPCGMYDLHEDGTCLGLPRVIGRDGILATLELPLSDWEVEKLHASAKALAEAWG